MIWLDWLILVLIAYNLISGLFSGLVRSLVNLVALIGAFLLTPVLKAPLTAIVQSIFALPAAIALPLGTSLTWTGIYVLISVAGLIWAKAISKTPLKWIDRLGGAAFGLLISGLLILLPLALVDSIPVLQKVKPLQSTLKESVIVPYLEPGVRFVRLTIGPALVNYWLKERDHTRMQESLPSPSSGLQKTPPRSQGTQSPSRAPNRLPPVRQ